MKLLFGGLIAVILLGLYSYSVIHAIILALQASPPVLGAGYANTMTTVGGLVSALVIAELAITKPGDPPVARALAAGTPADSKRRLTLVIVTCAFVAVWLLLGVASYVVGVLMEPANSTTLKDHGNAWLGLAVAAGYAYFGLSRGN